MTMTIGTTPQQLKVKLADGGVFSTGLRRKSGAWPSDTAAELRFASGATWTAEVDQDVLRFTKTAADVAAVLAADDERGVTLFIDGAVVARGSWER